MGDLGVHSGICSLKKSPPTPKGAVNHLYKEIHQLIINWLYLKYFLTS